MGSYEGLRGYDYNSHIENEADMIDETYDVVIRPDGTIVTVLTEIEDRHVYRDVAPLIEECNILDTEVEYLQADLQNAKRLMENVIDGWRFLRTLDSPPSSMVEFVQYLEE